MSVTTIANCFHHCGFSHNPEHQITAENEGEEQEEEEGENTSGEGDLLDRLRAIAANSTPEEVMEEWVTCDEDLPTSSELTDAEIIQLAQDETRDDSSDMDQDDVPIQKPPAADVRKAIQCLQDFCLCTQMDTSLLDSITVIEKHINNTLVAQAQQKKITDFFQ